MVITIIFIFKVDRFLAIQNSVLCSFLYFVIHTWSLDTITEVVGKIVHDVQQEGEVSHVVHVNTIRISSNGPQLVLISIFHTLGTTMKSMVISSLICMGILFHTMSLPKSREKRTALCLPIA